MSFISPFKALNLSLDEQFTPYLNTGHLYDLSTGIFIPGADNKHILNGGLGYVSGIIGRPHRHKTTVLTGQILSAMGIYPGSVLHVHDTETTLSKARILELVPDQSRVAEYNERIRLTDNTAYDAESYFAYMQELANEKITHAKDYTVEIPFIDPKTGKKQRMLIPTFELCDSWTELISGKVEEQYSKNSISDSGLNMVNMTDGNIKKRILSNIGKLAKTANIRFCLTGQIGNKFDLNPYAPQTKDQSYMRSNDTIKGMGSNAGFLMSSTLEIRSLEPLVIDKKESRYPDGPNTAMEDIVRLSAVLVRNKNGSSGQMLDIISSQAYGVQNALTNYHFLRENKDFGLEGNQVTQKSMLSPDVSFNRKTVRDKLRDYRLSRGIEILAQLCWIQNRWSLRGEMAELFNITPEKFAEQIISGKSIKTDALLESRGYWTYDPNEKREYMSIHDILVLLKKK